MARKMTLSEIREELDNVARAGEIFVDGDLCADLLMPYANLFTNGDDMDLNNETGEQVKKALMRLERFSRIPCSTAIHRIRPDMPGRYETLLLGFCGSPATTPVPPFQAEYKPPKTSSIPALASAFKGKRDSRTMRGHIVAKRMTTRKRAVRPKGACKFAVVEVFAPIKNSMGEVTAVLEVFASTSGK